MNEVIDPKDPSVAAAMLRAIEDTDDIEFLKSVIRNQIQRCPELWKVGRKEFVTLPTAEHMTEDMIDASRPVHLMYETSAGGVSCEQMIAHLGMGWPWTLKYIPPFMLEGGHLTKAGRAILCHSLTVAAYTDRHFKVKPTEQQIKDVKGERVVDEKILKEIEQAIVDDIEHAPIGIKDQSAHLLVGFMALMEYDLNGKVQQFPMRCNVHPPVELDGISKKMVSVLVSRSDVPREARTLVKRTGTKIMFTLNTDHTVEKGPHTIDTSGKPVRSAVRCLKIDSLICKKGVAPKTQQELIDEAVHAE